MFLSKRELKVVNVYWVRFPCFLIFLLAREANTPPTHRVAKMVKDVFTLVKNIGYS